MKKRFFFWSILLLTAAGIFFAAVYFAADMPWDFQQKSTEMTYQDTDRHFIECSFSLYAGCAMNFTTKVSCIVPADADGVPLPSAENILFYVPFNGEDGSTALERYQWLKDFAIHEGWTVFSMRINADSKIVSYPDKYYVYREAGWYPIIFRCRDIIADRFSIPVKPMFLMGQSSGSSMIQRLITAYPDKFSAGAGYGGRIYDFSPPTEEIPPLFLGHSAGDHVETANKEFIRYARQNGFQVWYGVFEPLSAADKHSASPEALEVMKNFLLSVADNDTAVGKILCHTPRMIEFSPPAPEDKLLQ